MLAEVLEQWEAAVARQSGAALGEVTRLYAGSVGGGKMIRGALVRLGYELAGGIPGPQIYRPAAAYELLHTGFLIHDDIMDNSSLRRGRPAVHVAAGGGHYNSGQAICLADAGFFLAHQVLAASGFSPERTVAALERFAQVSLDTAAGQMLDLKLAQPGAARREADVLRIYGLKTAAYTITGPLAVGAILGGASADLLRAIERFGGHVGTAFQIQDDILGTFAPETVTGKSSTSDIAENKTTILIAYALEHAAPPQLEVLQRIYGQADLTAAQADTVRDIFTACGALAYAQGLARTHADAGAAAAARVTTDAHYRALLAELAHFSVSRAS